MKCPYRMHPSGQWLVKSDGMIVSLPTRGKPKIVGYMTVQGYSKALCNKSRKQRPTHRIVAEAFHGPSLGRQCRHLDGDKLNNSVANLAWGTAKENTDDARRHGSLPFGERQGSSKLKSADVVRIRQRVAAGESYASVAKDFPVSRDYIGLVARRKSWRHI